MTLNLEAKKSLVNDVSALVRNSEAMIAADYRGLTVSEVTNLRSRARAAGVTMRVVRNTLARRAIQGTPHECLSESLVGPIILVFALESPGTAARILRDFVKENEKLQVRAIALSGQLYPGSDLNVIAELPTFDEAVSMFMRVLNAPTTKLVRTLAEPCAMLARTLGAIRDKKQA